VIIQVAIRSEVSIVVVVVLELASTQRVKSLKIYINVNIRICNYIRMFYVRTIFK